MTDRYDIAIYELENDLHEGRITQEEFKRYLAELNHEFEEGQDQW